MGFLDCYHFSGVLGYCAGDGAYGWAAEHVNAFEVLLFGVEVFVGCVFDGDVDCVVLGLDLDFFG